MSELNRIVGYPAGAGELVSVEKKSTHLASSGVSKEKHFSLASESFSTQIMTLNQIDLTRNLRNICHALVRWFVEFLPT